MTLATGEATRIPESSDALQEIDATGGEKSSRTDIQNRITHLFGRFYMDGA